MIVVFLLLGIGAGVYVAKNKYSAELERHAVVNANALIVALAHLEKGNVEYARGMLSNSLDGDVWRIQEYEGASNELAHEQYKLDVFRKIVDFKKKYPSISTPETAAMHRQIDAYLLGRTAEKSQAQR